MSCFPERLALPLLALLLALPSTAEELGDRWGTAKRERRYYPIVRVPTPPGEVVEAGAFCLLPDGRVAIGTRRGDIYLVSGIDEPRPEPVYHLFATGLDEIFGLDHRDDAFHVTTSAEQTRVLDTDGDGRADRFETLSDAWGYANYHEYAFGSKLDAEGSTYVALGLSLSYHSRALYRGWVLKVTPEGRTIPVASGLRSPGGIGRDANGQLFYMESQGPWNSSCSLKAITPGSFHGHPASYNWYPFAPELGPAPVRPVPGGRIVTERERVPELVPYAVVFPYIRMGRSISGFTVDRTRGRFGPFEDQLFLGDFSLSVVLRATTEEVKGIWQGACYPFREGLSTGILNVQFTQEGKLLAGGTGRGWPVRGNEPFALELLEWSGETPFEIERITIAPDGFDLRFTRPVDPITALDPASYRMGTFTHIYHGGYGGPEVDRTEPMVERVTVAEDRLGVHLELNTLLRGHVHEFDLGGLRDASGEELLHRHAYYTVNEIPDPEPKPVGTGHPVPEDPRWLVFEGGEGPGQGRHVVFVAADQEYRSEQSMPMLARMLAERHGFHTTVLFAQNDQGEVDPTLPIRWQEESAEHDIPGLEHLAKADLLVLFSRLITLPEAQRAHLYDYLDAGKPVIGLRTANHGFLGFDYELDGRRIDFGEDVLGGKFRGHHGRWHQDSTRGYPVPENSAHPILRGVEDVWGPSDVYRTYPEGEGLPPGCLALLMGQPLTGRQPGDGPNTDLIPLPVAWVRQWTGRTGKTARVFHSTMGSARDFQSAGMRRLLVNAAYWCLRMEGEIRSEASVEPVGPYAPLASGFAYEELGVVPRPPEAWSYRLEKTTAAAAEGVSGVEECRDERGNVYRTGTQGVHVTGPGGQDLGHLPVPEPPTGVSFGGPRRDMLIITTGTSSYAVRMDATGLIGGD